MRFPPLEKRKFVPYDYDGRVVRRPLKYYNQNDCVDRSNMLIYTVVLAFNKIQINLLHHV